MILLFYLAAGVALISTVAVVLQSDVVHALIYLILSLLAVAVIFIPWVRRSRPCLKRSFMPEPSWCCSCL